MEIIQSIQNRIYEIREERVMLDFDLAELYETPTKVFNQAVKRNLERFPPDFMFQLLEIEWNAIQSGIMTSPMIFDNRSQIVTGSKDLQKHRSKDAVPYAFTEQGIAMLSSVLHSSKAINMNIAIMRAFVEIRRSILHPDANRKQLESVIQRLNEHDIQLSQIYDALENLLDEKAAQRKWEARERIGYKTSK
jgi:hypothetical protein